MEEGRANELPHGENAAANDEQPPQKKAKYAQVASVATEKDSDDRKNGSFPPVRAQGLTGDTFVLEGCRAVGNVMARIAMGRNIFADRVVVIDPQSGRKLEVGENTAPVAQFVIINEEDAVVDIDSTMLNLRLHSQEGDRKGCSRLLERLGADAAEFFLWDVIVSHDAERQISAKSLMEVGVPGGPAFLRAANRGYTDSVAFILSIKPSLIEAEYGEVDSRLDAAECTVDHAIQRGDTALIQAAVTGKSCMVGILLEARADTAHANARGNTALLLAAHIGHADVVDKLIGAGASLEFANPDGDSALTLAARIGHTYIVEKLLAAGANVCHANTRGNAALILATRRGHVDLVGKLLAARADVERANSYGDTALHEAAGTYRNSLGYSGYFDCGRRSEAISKLLVACANVEHANSYGDTALHEAARSGCSHVVIKLIAAGADCGRANWNGDTALTLAAGAGLDVTVGVLLTAGASVDCANSDGNTALNAVAGACIGRYGHEPLWPTGVYNLAQDRGAAASKLLAAGAQVDHANAYGDTALTSAARNGRFYVVMELLAARAHVAHANSRGDAALTLAACGGHTDVVGELLVAEASVGRANSGGDSALTPAALKGRSGAVGALLAAGASVEHANACGDTASTIAAGE